MMQDPPILCVRVVTTHGYVWIPYREYVTNPFGYVHSGPRIKPEPVFRDYTLLENAGKVRRV